MILKILKAEYAGDFRLALEYNNGAKVLSDMAEALRTEKRTVFEPIKNKDNFKDFSLDFGTVVWNGGLDIAPEFLLSQAIPQSNDKTSIDTINYARALYKGSTNENT